MKFKKGIVVIPTMGFANRIRFLAAAKILFQNYTENFYVYWDKCDGFKCNFNEIFTTLERYKTINKETFINSKYLFFGHIHIAKIFEKIKQSSDSSFDYLVITGGHQIVYKQPYAFSWLKNKSEFYNNIIWSETIIRKFHYIVKRYNLNLDNTIAMHIRCVQEKYDSKDIKNNKLLNFNLNSPIKKFKDFIKMVNKDKTILILTNSDKTKEEIVKFRKEISNKPNIIILDQDNYSRLNVSSIIQSVVEFILMSKCKMIIGTYMSSFSDEASFFNLIPKLIVLDDSIKCNPELRENYKQKYHCSNLRQVFNNLCINSSTNVLIDCFQNLV